MSEPAIEHRHLRSAIEYAVVMGDELRKRKASITVPRPVRDASGKARVPTAVLGRLRRAIEADDTFRTAIAAGASAELIDPIGLLWLQRPEGWQAAAGELVADLDAAAEDADLRTALRREEKRRLAAEQTAVRLRADVVERDAAIETLRDDVDGLRADLTKAADELTSLRTEIVDVRNEARHARDREAAAKARLDHALADSTQSSHGDAGDPGAPGRSGDDATGESVAGPEPIERTEITDVARTVRDLADRLDALLAPASPAPPDRAEGRRPLALPGGVIASSARAAEFLLRSDAVVLVDGYNVAKLAWPNLPLADQRTRLLDAMENLVRRFAADITVVFDGAAVVGAHTTRRRMLRVVFSSEGVIADDVIRDEVRRLPATRAVAVVTNDAEIVSDVKADGANVIPSNALIAVL